MDLGLGHVQVCDAHYENPWNQDEAQNHDARELWYELDGAAVAERIRTRRRIHRLRNDADEYANDCRQHNDNDRLLDFHGGGVVELVWWVSLFRVNRVP